MPRGEAGEGSRRPGLSQAPGRSERVFASGGLRSGVSPRACGAEAGGCGSRGHAEGTGGLRACPSQVPPPGGSRRTIQTRAPSARIRRSPRLHASWPRRPRRTSRGKRRRPPWSDAPPSYTALLQPPKPSRSALQIQDLQPTRRPQVPTHRLCHPRSSIPPPPASAVPGVVVPLQEPEWGSPRPVGRLGVLALPLTGPETVASH